MFCSCCLFPLTFRRPLRLKLGLQTNSIARRQVQARNILYQRPLMRQPAISVKLKSLRFEYIAFATFLHSCICSVYVWNRNLNSLSCDEQESTCQDAANQSLSIDFEEVSGFSEDWKEGQWFANSFLLCLAFVSLCWILA